MILYSYAKYCYSMNILDLRYILIFHFVANFVIQILDYYQLKLIDIFGGNFLNKFLKQEFGKLKSFYRILIKYGFRPLFCHKTMLLLCYLLFQVKMKQRVIYVRNGQNQVDFQWFININSLQLIKMNKASITNQQCIQKIAQQQLQQASQNKMISNPESSSMPSAQTPNLFGPNLNIICLIQKQLSCVPSETILYLCRRIYPVEIATSNAYASLYKTLLQFLVIQFSKDRNTSYQSFIGQVLKIASQIDGVLYSKLAQMLKREDVKIKFTEQLRKKTTNTSNSMYSNGNALQNNSYLDSINASVNKYFKKSGGTTILQNLGSKYSDLSNNKYANLLGRELINEAFKKDTEKQKMSQDECVLIAEKYMKEKSLVQCLLNKIRIQKQLTAIDRLASKKCLICQNNLYSTAAVQSKTSLDKNLFKCSDCLQIYHKKCMPRQNNCAICQLKNMNPLQKTKVPLFIGILKKGVKRHQIQFQLTKSQINELAQQGTPQKKKNSTAMPSIQLRSLRLKQYKDPVSNFINLFPDACIVTINNRNVQFKPLHKQSSLKYRRDECMKISGNCQIGTNRIVVTQRTLKKDVKNDERIQPQNHIVGVYVVDNLVIPKPSNKLQQFLTKSGYIVGNHPQSVEKFLQNLGCRVSQFQQSQDLMRKNLFIGSQKQNEGGTQQIQQEVTCQSLKISIICSLTLQKMKFPGRTVFCKHFACFDIYNFILLNAQAKAPKWQCPICKASAYKFVIDCMVNSIVQQLSKLTEGKKSVKENQIVYQIQFNTKFQIKFFNSQGNMLVSKSSKQMSKENITETQFVPGWISNIYDLPIEGKNKRERIIQQKQAIQPQIPKQFQSNVTKNANKYTSSNQQQKKCVLSQSTKTKLIDKLIQINNFPESIESNSNSKPAQTQKKVQISAEKANKNISILQSQFPKSSNSTVEVQKKMLEFSVVIQNFANKIKSNSVQEIEKDNSKLRFMMARGIEEENLDKKGQQQFDKVQQIDQVNKKLQINCSQSDVSQIQCQKQPVVKGQLPQYRPMCEAGDKNLKNLNQVASPQKSFSQSQHSQQSVCQSQIQMERAIRQYQQKKKRQIQKINNKKATNIEQNNWNQMQEQNGAQIDLNEQKQKQKQKQKKDYVFSASYHSCQQDNLNSLFQNLNPNKQIKQKQPVTKNLFNEQNEQNKNLNDQIEESSKYLDQIFQFPIVQNQQNLNNSNMLCQNDKIQLQQRSEIDERVPKQTQNISPNSNSGNKLTNPQKQAPKQDLLYKAYNPNSKKTESKGKKQSIKQSQNSSASQEQSQSYKSKLRKSNKDGKKPKKNRNSRGQFAIPDNADVIELSD